MPLAAQLRQQIETGLQSKMTGALSPRARIAPVREASGIAPLDSLLHGGFAVGSLSELIGPTSSGRTSAAFSYLGHITQTDRVAAWIDVSDTFDPETAAANGLDLERLLWVRCNAHDRAITHVEKSSATPMVSTTEAPVAVRGGGSPHPRAEGRGMSEAIGAMLQPQEPSLRRQKRAIGTPGAPNRPLTFRSEDREEQVSSDRVPSHRAETALATRTMTPLQLAQPRQDRLPAAPSKKPWDALDHALRTADLLLQGGGFSVIVLDLGNVPPEMAWRIPLATWFRFRAACERTQVSLLVLTQHPCTRSSAELVVRLQPGQMQAQGRVLTGIAYQAETERQRFEPQNVVPFRKPPQAERARAAHWKAEAAWGTGR